MKNKETIKDNFATPKNENVFTAIIQKMEYQAQDEDDYQSIEDYYKDRKLFETHNVMVRRLALQEGRQTAKIEIVSNYKKQNRSSFFSGLQTMEIDMQQCEQLCNATYEKYRKQIEMDLTPGELELGFQYGLEQSFEETFEIEFKQETQKIRIEITKNCKKSNVDIKIISQATGLSVEEIKQL